MMYIKRGELQLSKADICIVWTIFFVIGMGACYTLLVVQALRPTVTIIFPLSLIFFSRHRISLIRNLGSADGLLFVVMIGLLYLGHILGTDTYYVRDVKFVVAGAMSMGGVLIVWFVGVVVGEKPILWKYACMGLLSAFVIQAIGIFIMPPEIGGIGHVPRYIGFQENPNITLQYVLSPYFMVLGLARNRKLAMGIIALAPFAVLNTLWTVSKGGSIALLLGAAVFIGIMILGSSFAKKVKILIAFFCITFGVGYGLKMLMPEAIEERVNSYQYRVTESLEGEGIHARTFGYKMLASDKLLSFERLIGRGYLNYEHLHLSAVLPHNTLLDIYVIAGIPAFFLCCVILGRLYLGVAHKAVIALRTKKYILKMAALTAVMAVLAILILIQSVLSQKILWLLYGMMRGMLNSSYLPRTQSRNLML